MNVSKISILGVEYGSALCFSTARVITNHGEALLMWTWSDRPHASLVAKFAKRHIGKEVPGYLQEALIRLLGNPGPFLPKKVVRPVRGEVSTSSLFDDHSKQVPLDMVILEDRWEVSLRDERYYRLGYYSYSRVYITSVLRVRDLETGAFAELREQITPEGDGPNQFEKHLGEKVLAIRVESSGIKVLVKTSSGRSVKVHKVYLRKPA